MSDVMVDTSAWIDYFRGRKGAATDLLDALLDADRAVLCGVVEMELLRGVRPGERSKLRSLLGALRFVETERRDFVAAGERLSQLREKGVSIPATDAVIAMVCKRHGLFLLTLDEHFHHLPEVRLLCKA